MTNPRNLSPEEINKLSSIADRIGNTKIVVWPPKHQLPILVEAFTNGAKSVVLGDKVFRIQQDGGKFFIKPTSGFVPCGWFDLDKLRREVEIDNVGR